MRKFDFIRYKKVYLAIFLVISLAGLLSLMTRGFNYGIDFTGGTLLQIPTEKFIEEAQIREITNTFDPKASINYLGDQKNELQIRTTKDLSVQERTDIFQKMKEKFDLKATEPSLADKFGPQVGKELRNKAIISVLIASLGMLLYITFRFQLSFGVAAVLALLHDVIIVTSLYAIFQLPVNRAFVAAMLTVVGYSINDTIVVFDRIRENLHKARKNDYEQVANLSINQTLTRSINTSLTTIIAIIGLYIFGTEAIREFTLPLIAGIAIGTYSSICVASPIWTYIKKKKGNV